MKIRFSARIWRHLFYIVLIGLFHLPGYSQETSCAEKLKTAQSFFEKGQVEDIPTLISGCLKSGFTSEESLTAYKLLIQVYLFKEKLELADSSMLAFLKKNPEYQINPTDHSSFIHLYNNFQLKKVVQISIHIGTNLPFIIVMKQLSEASMPGKKFYSSDAFNFSASLEAKFMLNEKMDMNIEAGYTKMSFENTEHFMGFSDIIYTESQMRFEIPLTVTYDFKNSGIFTPYGRLGFGPSFTIRSIATAEFKTNDGNNPFYRPGREFDRIDSRIAMDLFTQAGAGMKLKTRQGFLFAEIRSNLGFLNQTVREGLSAEELGGDYYYVDDDFRTNTINFNLGYTRIFYKPSKREE